jgi:hypothetical protein
MINFKLVSYQYLLDHNFQEILIRHHEALNAKELVLDFDHEAFLKLDSIGMLHNIAVMYKDDLVGYAVYFVHQHFHHKTTKYAVEDMYWIEKKYRTGRTGLRLFQFIEKTLKEKQVNIIITGTKVCSDNTRLLEYLGYEFTDKLFTKQI